MAPGAGAMADDASAQGFPPTARRVVAVVNPVTRRNAAVISDLLRRGAPSGVDVQVRLTRGPGDAVHQAREASTGADLVVAVGGDGTVADVATALHGTGLPLGIVPAGSTNIVARDLGIPTNPRDAIALLFGVHHHATIDVGLCGERCFLHMAGAGFDSRLFAAANPALKRRVGWLAYLPPAARGLRLPPTRFTIVTDGETVEVGASLVLVANGASIITPGLALYPGIRKDDGHLDVLIFAASGLLGTTRLLGRLVTRSLVHSPDVLRLSARRVQLTAEPPLPVQLDGDVVEQTPVTFGIAPSALRVVVPGR